MRARTLLAAARMGPPPGPLQGFPPGPQPVAAPGRDAELVSVADGLQNQMECPVRHDIEPG